MFVHELLTKLDVNFHEASYPCCLPAKATRFVIYNMYIGVLQTLKVTQYPLSGHVFDVMGTLRSFIICCFLKFLKWTVETEIPFDMF